MRQLFNEYFYNSLLVTCKEYPKSIYHIYDNEFLRMYKFNKINNITNKEFLFKDIKDYIVIEQDYKTECLWLKYSKIWQVFETKYGLNYYEIRDMIKGWLDEDSKMTPLTPILSLFISTFKLDEDSKMTPLTPASAVVCHS